MDKVKVPNLTEEQRQLLLSKTPFVLPDNPSDKNFSPAQIKRKMYEGFLVLFDLVNATINSVNIGFNSSGNGTLSVYAEENEYVIPSEDR